MYDPADIANPPTNDIDMGTLGQGFQMTYSKEGVCTMCQVSGWIGKKDSSGKWMPDAQTEESVVVSANMEITNGVEVWMTTSVDENYKLESVEALRNFGLKELAKTAFGAKGAVYNSGNIPLVTTVGSTVSGSSALSGSVNIYVTAMNRTTDVQQGTIETGITGTRSFDSGSGGLSEVWR
jgi:hypothetical protein